VPLDTSRFHHASAEGVTHGILQCYCSEFPVVGGVPVMTVEGVAETAREQVDSGHVGSAWLTMVGQDDEDAAGRFERVCRSDSGTYRDAIEALGPEFAENRYFLYRFSDPTFVVADAVVRAIGTIVLGDGGRALDLCGGSGHLTRSLQRVSRTPPILMDWTFVKLWLALRFTSPGAEFVCADAHAPLPFAPGAFRLAVCSDAFHYIWSKALLARDMLRVIDRAGVAALTHAHNARQENPSAGMPLPPEGYRDVFEGIDARVFSERGLLDAVIAGRLDLSVRHRADSLDADPALTAIATTRADVFVDHALRSDRGPDGSGLRVNPLYDVSRSGSRATLRLRFPSEAYAEEYAACLRYLPETLTIDAAVLDALDRGGPHPELGDLVARRIVLDLPERYL
jgi:SAM-dependent methyltransferase